MNWFSLILLIFINQSYCLSLNEVAEPYYKASEYQRMEFSPNGKYLAAETYYDAREHIEIIDIDKKKSYVVFNGTNGIDISISDIHWIDSNSLIIQLDKIKSNSSVSVFKVLHLKFGKVIEVASSFEFEKIGYIVDGLTELENMVYFAHLTRSKKITSGVYKINLSTQESMLQGLQQLYKIGSTISFPYYWLVNRSNNIGLIMSEHKDRVHYWLKVKGKWKKIYSTEKNPDNIVYPLAITFQNQFIAIKRLDTKDKKGVYLLNSNNLEVEKELYYSEGFDVNSVVIDKQTSTILAIRHIKSGIMHDVSLDKNLHQAHDLIKTKYPEFDNLYISGSQDKNDYLYYIHNFQNEGIYVTVDIKNKSVKKIIEKSSWRKKLDKGTLKTVNYMSDDGYLIESYLSQPQKKKIKALLVMPHGGPIGVRSYGYFDSDLHFLASFGIAVLKINYRGSSGFGNKFQQAGKLQWGNKIEKDINDVVSHVIKKYKINKNKICSGGMSYGGYSALMLHINYPERYKCIISMAGPTDLPLMFSSSDWNKSKESIKRMIEIIGDPHNDIDKLKKQSPVYNAKKIEAPVLLFHGTDDPRVNVEHSVRLEFILKKLGKSVDLKLMSGVKHGFNLLSHYILFATETLKFINASLSLELELKNKG